MALRNKKSLVLIFVWGWVLGPAFGYLIARILPLAEAYIVVVLICSLTLCAPFLQQMVGKACGDMGFAGAFIPLVAAGTIAVVMLFFTDMLAFLPNAALAGIVTNAVLSLIEVHELRELWRMRRSEFWIAAVCLLSVLVLGPLRAVMIAFLLSVIDVIRRASRPETSTLVEAPDGSHFLPAADGKASGSCGLMVHRFGAPLYFANATLFLDDVERLVTQAPIGPSACGSRGMS